MWLLILFILASLIPFVIGFLLGRASMDLLLKPKPQKSINYLAELAKGGEKVHGGK